MIEAVPTANQTFREIVFGIISARAENEIKPRVFFEDFPNRVLYVGDAPAGGGWRECFLADTSKPDQPTVFTAETLPPGHRPRQAHRGHGARRTARATPRRSRTRPSTRSRASPS